MLVCVFGYANGIPPYTFMEWATRMRLLRDDAALRHVESLWKDFANGKHEHLYAFNVGNTRYEYVNGLTRHYIHRSRRGK